MSVAFGDSDRPALAARDHAAAWSMLSLGTLALWCVLFAAILAASIMLSGGRLVFTLDDPYIHLAVADQILAGGYGVNAAEFSSPSSSIIWPYLLALTETARLGPLGPLLLNAAFTCAALAAMLRLIEATGLFADRHERPFAGALALLSICLVNAIALPMTGMEHSLHVWTTLITCAGLLGAARGQAPTALHVIALVALPLVRFEGAAFALASLMAFGLLGYRRFAVVTAAVIGACLVAYATVMAARGLPLLPSSVLLKSRIIETTYEHHSALASLIENLTASLNNIYGQRLLALGIALGALAVALRSDPRLLIVFAAVLAGLAAHLGFGQYDIWFHRYETYAIAVAAIAVIVAIAELKPRLTSRRWLLAKLATIVLLTYAAVPALSSGLLVPFSARGIHEQQEQMGRFVREFYRSPVGVNDLGLVTYRNPSYVLDLFGLGSEEVRKAKLAGHYGPDEMAAMVAAHQVGLVMIYDSWFPRGLPAEWRKVAVLHAERVSAAEGKVSFYRTPHADPVALAGALQAFKPTLPSRTSLEILPP